MKKVRIVCVGKIKEAYLRDGIAEYGKRLRPFCDFSIEELEDRPDRPDTVARESAQILQRLHGFTVLTDIAGQAYTSPQLAEEMNRAYTAGNSEITFVIGGSGGVSEAVKSRADIRLSFGKVTFPHQLMRLMLCEQIYRAFTILAGMPYHK